MIEKIRIACFFTGGFTELNAMKAFMKKVNCRADYIQLCPCGTRKSKDSIRNRRVENIRREYSGKTGNSLIDFVVSEVGKNRFQEEKFGAILIEDDKDDRFLKIQDDGSAIINEAEWIIHKNDVKKRISEKCPNIPVIFFYAAPEVESWFIADFDNSFGKAYQDVFTTQQNTYFSVVFRKYVREEILTNKYCNCIEQYGYFNNDYQKLSERMQNALDTIDFLEKYKPTEIHPTVHYSKRRKGEEMLWSIDPDVVINHCDFFFKEGLQELRALI